MPSVTTKITITYFSIASPGDMADALVAAMGMGYRGKIDAYQNPLDEEDVWSLELHGPANPNPVVCTFGDVLVWDGTYLKVMPLSDFTAIYT